mgnify:CR=1 FL=1
MVGSVPVRQTVLEKWLGRPGEQDETSVDGEENALPSKRERRMTIRQKRKRRAKKKLAEGFKRVVERTSGRKKVRFVKPAAS